MADNSGNGKSAPPCLRDCDLREDVRRLQSQVMVEREHLESLRAEVHEGHDHLSKQLRAISAELTRIYDAVKA